MEFTLRVNLSHCLLACAAAASLVLPVEGRATTCLPSPAPEIVPLNLTGLNVFSVPVTLGEACSKTLDMTVDTGSAISGVSAGVADALIAAKQAVELQKQLVTPITGDWNTFRMIRIKTIRVGCHVVPDVIAAVINAEVIGLPELRHSGRFTIDAAHEQLIFNDDPIHPMASPAPVPRESAAQPPAASEPPAQIAERVEATPANPAAPAPSASEPKADPSAAQGTPANPAATTQNPPAASTAPAPSAGRAAMLVASADNPEKPVVTLGSTVWSLIPAAPGQPATVAVKAEADIPDLKMHATMTLRKNTDPTLQATHTIDLQFSFADGAPITGFKDVGLPQLRMEDSTTAEALTSAKVKISDVYFVIALAEGDSDTARNLDLMRTRAWFDFPLMLNDDRMAKVVFQKSAEGQAMLEKAFDAWKETPAAAPEQEGKAQPPLYQSSDAQARPPAAEAPPPPTPGAPPKSEAQAQAPTPTPAPHDEQKAQNAPPAHGLTPAPAGDLPADVNPKPNNVSASAAAPAAPAPPAKAPVGEALPTVDDLPQYKFTREVDHSQVTGGSAESRYLTTVYGMIKAHLHETAELHLETANKPGAVDFHVDEGGNLVGRKLISSSGSPNLDMAVMAAIAAAAPYPAPPNWSPLYLTYNFGKKAQSNTDTSETAAPAPIVPSVPAPAPADTTTAPATPTYRFTEVGVADNTLILTRVASALMIWTMVVTS
jgi:TonB family protein